MQPWLKYVLLGLLLLLLGSIPLAMQLTAGSIEGLITNQAGPVSGATIEARNIMTGVETRGVSDQNGHFKIVGLREGRYSLRISEERHESVLSRGSWSSPDASLARTWICTLRPVQTVHRKVQWISRDCRSRG